MSFKNPCELCSPIAKKIKPCPTCASKSQLRAMPQANQLGTFLSTMKEPPEIPYVPTSAFGIQLEASLHGGSQDTIRSTIVAQKEKPINRNFGVGFEGMLREISEVERRILERNAPYIASKPESSYRGIPTKKDEADEAFVAAKMKELEARILNRISKISLEKPKPTPVARSAPLGFGEGFMGQIEAAFGSSEQTSRPVERSVPPVGFRAMLDASFSPPRGGRQAIVTSLEDGETILMRRGFCDKGTLTRDGKKLTIRYIPT